MRVDGREIADKIFIDLRKRVGELQKKGIIPHLTVILVGDNPASVAYVLQKQKKGEAVGCKVTVLKYEETITTEDLAKKIEELNSDASVHAILLQRPLPSHIDIARLEMLTDPQKDIDGFHPDSPFILPLPLAVVKILEEIYMSLRRDTTKPKETTFKDAVQSRTGSPLRQMAERDDEFLMWLRSKSIVVIGKGDTGGNPIIEYFKKLSIPFQQIDSKTPQPDEITKRADIIISAVGKQGIIKPEMIKQGVILISVGIYKGEDGKLHGDYDEEEIKDIAAFYTPTPGGVGPVNVAMLVENVLMATGDIKSWKE